MDPNSSSNELRLKLEYSEPLPLQKVTHYDYFLPSENLNFIYAQNWSLKFGAAKVISFPLIEEIGINQRFTSDDSGSVLLSGGNPELIPYSANQYDISAEYLNPLGSAFSIAYFYKDMKNFIATETIERPFTGEVSQGVKARRAEIVEIVNRSQNVAGGSISGVETSIFLNLSSICDFCDGLTLDSNFTRIISNNMNVDPISLASVKEPEGTIEGLSEFSYNLNIAYQSPQFSIFIAWNWRSAFLHARQGSRTSGIPEHMKVGGN
ncbi:MAG: iron complex outermembrane receptor protein [Paraglaciecola sp.]